MNSCRWCKSKNTVYLKTKLGYQLRQCRECGLIYTDCQLNKNDLEALYDREYFLGGEQARGYVDYEADSHCLKRNFQKKLHLIKHYRVGGRLLDVGCATGIFCGLAEKQGFTSFGIDLAKWPGRLAKKRLGKRFKATSLLDYHSADPFAVITMWDVVEHFVDPKKNLIKAFNLLEKNGYLYHCRENFSY